MKRTLLLFLAIVVLAPRAVRPESYNDDGLELCPHDSFVTRHVARLESGSASVRAGAAESLGYLRAYTAADALAKRLEDDATSVRREAALSLAWCGGRDQVPPLIDTLDDEAWDVGQAAWVALTNLTGMEFPYNAHASDGVRAEEIETWRAWWASVPANNPLKEVLELLAPGEGRELAQERGMRALGALGGDQVDQPILEILAPYLEKESEDSRERRMVQAGIRSLGRIGGPQARRFLIDLLENRKWARYAADALGDCGDVEAARALIDVYPRYAMDIERASPTLAPDDDRPGFDSSDRMYETPFAIASALTRLPLDGAETVASLREIAPLFVSNLRGNFDGALLYEPEAYQRVTAYLLERAGIREAVCDLCFQALGFPVPDPGPTLLPARTREALLRLAREGRGGTFHASEWLVSLYRGERRIPELLELLEHERGWVRIDVAKILMFMNEPSALAPIERLLENSRPEAEHGFFGKFLFTTGWQGQDEYNAPSPCWREAFTHALGRLGGGEQVPLLVDLMNDEKNVLEVRYAAAIALDEIGDPPAIKALRKAEARHPLHRIRIQAREALWKRGIPLLDEDGRTEWKRREDRPANHPDALVFIKGSNDMPNDFQIDIWRQTYSTTDSGPTYRLGKNIFRLEPARPDGEVTQLTRFEEGYVADIEVSWDGTRVLFAHRGDANPWWRLYEMNADGSDLRQLTRGPYHDVQPNYLPDGRIVFSSTRIGMRDEYHGYLATGLTVMNPDGSDIHCIGFNLGRDNEPSLLPDGRILFSRLELFYSRLKTEITVQAVFPDGTRNATLYGPERRDFWHNVTVDSGEGWWGESGPRHRVLRLTQPQPIDRNRVICATTGGAAVVGPGRLEERLVPRFNNMAVTCPFPIGEGRVLCSASVRTFKREDVDLGIYEMDSRTGALELVYNDPETADFEARPLEARLRPPVLSCEPRSREYTARLLCDSVRNTRDPLVAERGKLVRIVEGQPVVSRHHSHTSRDREAWKNHVGSHARVLGTVPLAADGSFFVEIPADRLVHCEVLDGDRRVVGNQLIWMYGRPGETKSCVGCHETPDTAPVSQVGALPQSVGGAPLQCLPHGDEFSYRAKAWQKGTLRDETEERTRTVHAVNLPGRY